MSSAAPLQNAAGKSQASNKAAQAGLLLQCKCACGGSGASSLTGECEACKKKRLQRKLSIGASNDPLEHEADRVADQVMATSPRDDVSSAPLRIQCFTGQAAADAGMAPASVDRVLAGSGRALEPGLQQDMGRRFGYDFSRVRVHIGATAEQSARDVDAHAYTVGENVVFGAGRFAPDTHEGKRLLAHELVHVVQQGSVHGSTHAAVTSASALPRTPRSRGAALRRQPAGSEPQPTVVGDSVRNSPSGGVQLGSGTLVWQLRFVGNPGAIHGNTFSQGTDVDITASFTPSAGTSCPTVTFMQIVRPTTGGLPDTAHLLFTREPQSGSSVDVLENETEPFYGAGPTSGGTGLSAEHGATLAGTGTGHGGTATFHDTPIRATSAIPNGQMLVREFELAVICAETAQTFGSLRWGYTKNSRAQITLTGATVSDVRVGSASPTHEATRRAFYSGYFQHSLSGFARGSAVLSRTHRRTLDAIARHHDIARVILVGANDFSGGPEANSQLSQRRAEAAKAYLMRHGVPEAKITVEGHGVEAREPNARGQAVAANRRVDVHVERGAEGSPHQYATGSPREAFRLRRQNPHRTLGELVQWIGDLRLTHGTIPRAECNQLSHLMWALNRWRMMDPSVPDVRVLYGREIVSLRRRCESDIPFRMPTIPLRPLTPPNFTPRITDSVEGEPF
jgi:outer membrane protein OmpA-like peptidoglycan-associated protein